MKFVYKGLLSLFIEMALVSCAGTDSSSPKESAERPDLSKAGTPVADSLVSKMPEFARSVFKGTSDSIPGEYYYHATDGRIDTLFKKEGEQYKPVISIAYDFLIGQSNFELKKGNVSYFVKDNVLTGEENFPKCSKAYWGNGKIKGIATGILYRDDQDVIQLDSGHLELYSESGKVLEQSDWKDKNLIAGKGWNENGVLTGELDFPNYSKEYWDNGNPQKILTGLLYRDDQGVIQLDSGYEEIYFENGKIQVQNDWKDKQIVTHKEWNDNGVLIKDINLPQYYKEYWDNGKQKGKIIGILYRNDKGVVKADSGYSESYFENEKTHQHNDWKNKLIIAQKEWNENGVLVKDSDFPKYTKEYWDNGTPKQIFTGILYRENDLCSFSPDSGHSEIFFENGKTKEQTDWKNKQAIASKIWNENGVLIKDIDYPKHYKEYWDNGMPKLVLTGLLYRNDQGDFDLDSGRSEKYFENGKIQLITDWKNRQHVAQKEWNEKGKIIKDLDFPKYAKTYWDNGKPQTIMTGLLYWDNQGVVQVDSGLIESYFENGKIQRITGWKDKQYITQKEWSEKGQLLIELDFPKHAKTYWDNGKLKQKTTGLLYRDNSGDQNSFAVDSGHSELYFENGKIKEHNDWKSKQPIASKQWNENGVLVKELAFPKYFKEYWDNGKPKQTLTGLLYRDDYGNFHLDSGHSETFYENGKIYQQNDWKNKQAIASKQWNEDGILIVELDFPKSFKLYWNNGTPKVALTGILYKDDQGDFRLDSGHEEIYYENGQIQEQNKRKDKQIVARKAWNQNGTLTSELDFPRSLKNYWNDGKIYQIATGILYRDDQGGFSVDSGHSEIYFENGKIQKQNDWKGKQLVAQKEWNENGVLTREFVFPQYAKEYWDNGKVKGLMTGVLYRDYQGNLDLDSGHSESYFENGKINQQNDWKDKQAIASKQWNDDGILIKEFDFPKYYKEYWDNGKVKGLMTGLLYRDNQGNFNVDSGHSEIYFENGKIRDQKDWKNRLSVACKTWNEKGVLMEEMVFPKYYKKYWDNGKLKEASTGILSRDNQGKIHMESGHLETYFEKGTINMKVDAKDNQIIARKKWNESGVLVEDWVFSRYAKDYWDNGKIRTIAMGTLYRNDQGAVRVDSGQSEIYFENGKIKEQNHWKNKQLVAHKEWNENGVLQRDIDFPKYYKEYRNDGTPKNVLTGLLYRNAQGNFALDSGHQEIYFENGKINERSNWKNKQPVTAKRWNENGELVLDFPKYFTDYWDNGNLKKVLTGFIYLNNYGDFALDSGHLEKYFENGKIKEVEDWKDKRSVAGKKWYENGNLKYELFFPKYEKFYYENGSPNIEIEGTLYYADDNGIFIRIQDGFRKEYYKNGRMKKHRIYKEKELIKEKDWYENGNLEYDFNFPNYANWYYDNGKPNLEMKGTLYYDNQDKIQVQDGYTRFYSENGETSLANYKDKKLVDRKIWHKNGKLMIELVFPKYEKGYSDKGNLVYESEGILYLDDKEKIQVQDGFKKWYSEDGKLTSHIIYMGKKLVTEKKWYKDGSIEVEADVKKGFHKGYFPNGQISVDVSGKFHYDSNTIVMENGSKKWWYENGTLEYELVFPKYEKKYSDKGDLVYESEGTLYYDDKKEIQVQDGFRKEYSGNGKQVTQKNYSEKKFVGKTEWDENGIMTISVELPNRYREFYDDGKIKAEAAGIIVEEDDSFRIQDGTYNEYDPNGNVTYTATYKDFQRISEK